MPGTEPVLELRGVDKSFGPVDVLHEVSLKVFGGEVLCLLGDNGAGKSTLIKILAGVHKPTRGEILMKGEPVRSTARGTQRTAGSRPCTSSAARFRSCPSGGRSSWASSP